MLSRWGPWADFGMAADLPEGAVATNNPDFSGLGFRGFGFMNSRFRGLGVLDLGFSSLGCLMQGVCWC